MYEIISNKKDLNNIVNLAQNIEDHMSLLINILYQYKNKPIDTSMQQYIHHLLIKSADSIEGFEDKLSEISNYSGSISKNVCHLETIDILSKPDISNIVASYKINKCIDDIETVKDFVSRIITQINDQTTNDLLSSKLNN